MRTFRFRFLVAALAVLLGTALAQSQTAPPAPMPTHGHGFGRAEYMLGFYADYLNLSDAQQAQMKAILQKERPTLKPLMQQMHQVRQQLKQYEEGTFDEAKVRALATQQAATMVELSVQRTRIHNELFQVLTADQQTQLKQLEARRAARMQKHMGSAPAAPEQ
jgi:Spy/CpxP family protein refolding chaperone